jgi:tRNA(fMet)-specific endonuclease VapC
MRYLLDTNIVSHVIRDPHGHVATRIAAPGEDDIGISIIVASELRFGAVKRASRVLIAKVGDFLERIKIFPFESPADRVYADIRLQLETTGKPIGSNDLLIAAHALALGCTLVTDNEHQFSRVESLRVENWLR